MKEIVKLRKEIDEIDSEILALLSKRAEIVLQVGEFKRKAKWDLYAPEREREIYERLERLNPGIFPNQAIRSIFKEILSASLALEKPLRVAYLGPKTTFTHQACVEHFGFSAQYIPVESIKQVFRSVEAKEVDFGVVPIENSTEGAVTHTLDLFVDSHLKICGEIRLEISQNLLSKTGEIGEIRRIYSHPQALAQCRDWLERHTPSMPLLETESTAKAAEIASEDPSCGAIASKLAAELYNMKIVRANIQDNLNNLTRFLIIGNKARERTTADKTSIVFSVKDRVGVLYEILGIFAKNHINLKKIESRPSKQKAWDYYFFLDFEGHMEDERVKQALQQLEKETVFLKILGSYPKAVDKT
jgi:chorismate mutase/prephenate dehydratase